MAFVEPATMLCLGQRVLQPHTASLPCCTHEIVHQLNLSTTRYLVQNTASLWTALKDRPFLTGEVNNGLWWRRCYVQWNHWTESFQSVPQCRQTYMHMPVTCTEHHSVTTLPVKPMTHLKVKVLFRNWLVLGLSQDSYVRKTFVAGPLSAPLIPLPGLLHVINFLLTYLLLKENFQMWHKNLHKLLLPKVNFHKQNVKVFFHIRWAVIGQSETHYVIGLSFMVARYNVCYSWKCDFSLKIKNCCCC